MNIIWNSVCAQCNNIKSLPANVFVSRALMSCSYQLNFEIGPPGTSRGYKRVINCSVDATGICHFPVSVRFLYGIFQQFQSIQLPVCILSVNKGINEHLESREFAHLQIPIILTAKIGHVNQKPIKKRQFRRTF